MTEQALSAALATRGLRSLGEAPDGDSRILLIGPAEPDFWGVFTQSAEYKDGAPNPLDRWSQRIITELVDRFEAEPLFPFGGPPYAPFYTWAVNSGQSWPSPIGFLVHAEAGLFVSFRGALRLPGQAHVPSVSRPCDTCTGQPCANACPVGAFDDGYDVAACKSHVTSDAGTDCRTNGCRARRACPIGQGLRLSAQAEFHMEAFL